MAHTPSLEASPIVKGSGKGDAGSRAVRCKRQKIETNFMQKYLHNMCMYTWWCTYIYIFMKCYVFMYCIDVHTQTQVAAANCSKTLFGGNFSSQLSRRKVQSGAWPNFSLLVLGLMRRTMIVRKERSHLGKLTFRTQKSRFGRWFSFDGPFF